MPKEILFEKRGVLVVLANRRTPEQNAVIMDRHATHAARRLDNDIKDIIGRDKPCVFIPGITTIPETVFNESAIASTWPDFDKINANLAEARAEAAEHDRDFRETLANIAKRLESKGILPKDMRLNPDDVAEHEARQEAIRDMWEIEHGKE
jgi:hypothetical protein